MTKSAAAGVLPVTREDERPSPRPPLKKFEPVLLEPDERQRESQVAGYIGKSVPRLEDGPLLKGQTRFTDDHPERPGTLHAAILRSPHAHAEIISIDYTGALKQPGVHAVLTGAEIRERTEPFLIVLRQPMDQWSLAVERVRFVGEAVALVVAQDRYQAEDALDHIKVKYRPLDAALDPLAAAREDAPLVHPKVGSNIPSDRSFSYGDPDRAFAEADRVVRLDVHYPRNSQTPLETYVIIADYHEDEEVYDVVSNFQGPFTVHPVISRALRVKGSQIRLRMPTSSGGGFGVKQAMFPYMVLMCVAARALGRPVKWVEDRLEHLTAAIAAPNRVIQGEAAVLDDGTVTAFRFTQLDDYGAYLRPPMPGPLYRMHGVMTGAYKMPNLALRNKVVMTNKTPSGMVRGFGGPQIYYAIERLMRHVADTLGMDHLQLVEKNLIPAGSFPYRAPAGALLDSGNYQQTVALAKSRGNLDELKARRERARAEGRLYGIGYAVIVEPAQSNMGYLSTINPAEYRKKAGPKGGNVAYATVNVDPLGAVSVSADSLPQGQGHATILAQIAAEHLGLTPDEVIVNMERDTQKDPWSIATGNYSSRFSSATAVSGLHAVLRVKAKLAKIAAQMLGAAEDKLVFSGGKVFPVDDPGAAIRFTRVAGAAHWSPGALPDGLSPGLSETVAISAPQIEPPNDADQVNTSLTYGLVFDFCGVEIDRDTGQVRIDKYVTTHDSGKLLNPLLANGQIYGAFAWGVGCALYEEFRYGEDGSFLSGTFADYLCPTAGEVPEPQIIHMETPSPFTPLGAKGIGEGNCMSTPACIANAVSDALGVSDLQLPLDPAKITGLMAEAEPPPPDDMVETDTTAGGRRERQEGGSLQGRGANSVPAAREQVWEALLSEEVLADIIPGCHHLEQVRENRFHADISLGVGIVKGRFHAEIALSELDPPKSVVLSGELDGPLGASRGRGRINLATAAAGTRVDYDYEVEVSGKVAAVGGRMLQAAADVLFDQFFKRLTARIRAGSPAGAVPWWRRLLRSLGIRA